MNERDFLLLMIDLETAISTNDVALAQTAIDKLDTVELSDDQISYLDDMTSEGIVNDTENNIEVCELIISNMKFIKDREYKLTLIEIASVSKRGDKEEISAWLENNAIAKMEAFAELSGIYHLAKILILLCSRSKNYNVMERIRVRLAEVDA